MTDYYDSYSNASTHPFRMALVNIDSQISDAHLQMNTNRAAYEKYVEQENRAQRLARERQQLLSIMASDLTLDLTAEKLQGEKK